MHATIPDYGKRSVRQFIEYKFPNAHFAVTQVCLLICDEQTSKRKLLRSDLLANANDFCCMLQQDFQRTLPLLDMKYHDLHRYLADSVPNADAKDEVALDDARQELLLRILKAEPPQNTLVFTNSIASANALFDFLEAQSIGEDGGQVLLFHKEVDRQQRQQVLGKLDDPNANVVVVCTDIAARGLDTTQVRHVVQYEFANDVVSHLHRIGRTARAGTAGKGLLHYFCIMQVHTLTGLVFLLNSFCSFVVTNIVAKENALVLEKIHEAGASSLDGAFSRKRSLRKKARKLRHEHEHR